MVTFPCTPAAKRVSVQLSSVILTGLPGANATYRYLEKKKESRGGGGGRGGGAIRTELYHVHLENTLWQQKHKHICMRRTHTCIHTVSFTLFLSSYAIVWIVGRKDDTVWFSFSLVGACCESHKFTMKLFILRAYDWSSGLDWLTLHQLDRVW